MARFSSSEYMLNGVSTIGATTSDRWDVSMRHKMSLQFTGSAITSGNCVFTVLVSDDDVTYVPYNRLVSNVSNTNVQNDTLVSSVTISSNGSAIVFFPVGDYFRYIKVVQTASTDGSYSTYLQAID